MCGRNKKKMIKNEFKLFRTNQLPWEPLDYKYQDLFYCKPKGEQMPDTE